MQVNDSNKNRRSMVRLALVCLFLQLALAPNFGIANGRINFGLIYAGVIALTIGGHTGVVAGFFAGLVFDLCTTGPVGLMSLLLTVAAFLMGIEVRNRIAEDFSGSVVLFVMCAFVVSVFYNLAMFLVGQGGSIVDMLFLRTLPTFILTGAAFVPFALIAGKGTAGSSLGGGLGPVGKHSIKYSLGKR